MEGGGGRRRGRGVTSFLLLKLHHCEATGWLKMKTEGRDERDAQVLTTQIGFVAAAVITPASSTRLVSAFVRTALAFERHTGSCGRGEMHHCRFLPAIKIFGIDVFPVPVDEEVDGSAARVGGSATPRGTVRCRDLPAGDHSDEGRSQSFEQSRRTFVLPHVPAGIEGVE